MELIDEKEAAVLLNCSIHKLQKDRRTKSPIPYYKIGKNVRYKRQDIDAYLEEQRFTSTSQYAGGENE